MSISGAMPNKTIAWAAAVSAVLTAGLGAQDKTVDLREIGSATTDLQTVSRELLRSLKLLNTDLDEAIARYDRGARAGQTQLPGADADLGSGHSNASHEAIRKLMLARMVAARVQQASAAMADS